MVKNSTRHLRLTWLLLGAAFTVSVALYSLVFFVPKTVTLAYSGDTCTRHLLLFPGLQKFTADEYTLEARDTLKIGNTAIISTTLCATPKKTPTPGEKTASLSPFGGWLFKKSFTITTPGLPKVASTVLASTPISAALPLPITLTEKDTLHTYRLAVADKHTPCSPKGEGAALSCDIARLGLAPDTEYTAHLQRSYKNKNTVPLATSTLKTLLPLMLTDAGIQNDQTVYETPGGTAFTFDKPLSKAEVTLAKKNSTEKLKSTTRLEKNTLHVDFPDSMDRKTEYILTVHQAISEDGSSLPEPIRTHFTLSGGPKVTAVSIGANNTPQSTTITLTFDQPLHESVDVTKFIAIKGVPGTIQRTGASIVRVTVQNAPLCAPFSISAAKGIKSGVNEEASDTDWRHDSRIICGTSAVIGHSVRGRPITAYYFGSGATTILFTGAIHGNEGSTYTTMMGWVHHLQVNAHKIPAGKRVVIVPNMNPDGIATGSRNNANNVNLGRNFPTANWKADIETANGVLKNGGGTSALSEPEARALANLTRQLHPRMEISFHSQGRLVGANKFGDSVGAGNIYASTVGYKTMYTNAEAVMGYPMTGEYEDWMGETMGLPAILIELPSHSGNYIQSQLTALWKMVNL